MEESSKRIDSRAMRKEQEREQRRMRDRQRRLSMSIEQKEQHLAKRRRNYQLRRLRAGQPQFSSQTEQSTWNEQKEMITASEFSAQCDHTGFSDGHCEQNAVRTKVDGLDAGSQKLARFPRRLRLNHIKHLARSLHEPVGRLSGTNQIAADLVSREDAANNCKLRIRLRLNGVKFLARALNSVRETTHQDSNSKS